MAIPERYDDIGTVNAVKLLPKIDSYNGYIQLYTELDSHIEEGDIVFITYSGNTNNMTNNDVLLDNYAYSILFNDFVYGGGYTQGYTVIYVNKNFNTFAIDRSILTVPPGGKIYDHYVSSIVCLNITMDAATQIDSTVFKYADINMDLGEGDINWVQGVLFDGNIYNVDIRDKYNINYLTLKLQYNEENNTITKFSNLNNDYYGYSYFFNLDSSVKSCEIYAGNFFNCNIMGDPVMSGNCMNGYFDNCTLTNYNIYNGYFKDSVVDMSCQWYYGIWDGGFFYLPLWRDGNFLNGVLGSLDYQVTWQNGYFTNGIFRGIYWENGTFLGGLFEGTGRTDTTTGQEVNTVWANGKFIGGIMKNSIWDHTVWKDGKVIGGTLYDVVINNGTIEGGNFYNSNVKNAIIEGGSFYGNYFVYGGTTTGYSYNYITDVTIYGGNFYSDLSGCNYIQDSISYGGNHNYSQFWNNNTIENGVFNHSYFNLPITVNDGNFDSCHFEKVLKNVSKATLRKMTLLNLSGTLVDRICLEFKEGHYFTQSNTGQTVTLYGFNTQELEGKVLTIIGNNVYRNPSTYHYDPGTGTYIYDFVSGVTSSYIIAEGNEYESYMFGDSGVVIGDLFDEPSGDFTLNDGIYKNTTFLGDVIVNSGSYNYSFMRDGVTFNNGVFNGSEFRSLSGQSDNTWNNGIFYNGVFGNNCYGSTQTVTLVLSNNFDIFRNGGDWDHTATTSMRVTGIYPRVVKNPYFISDDDEYNYSSWDSMQVEIDTGDGTNNWPTDYDSDVTSTTVPWNEDPWNLSTLPTTYKVRPYDIIFKIDCSTEENYALLSQLLFYKKSIEIVDLVDFDSGNIDSPYTSFKNLFKMSYRLHDYKLSIIVDGTTQYYAYVIFRFDDIYRLYANCSVTERLAYDRFYKNIWSIANTGYYSHPLPVINDSYADLDQVGNFTIIDTTGVSYDTKWIYASAPPPWWLSGNAYNFNYELGSYNARWLSTVNTSGTSVINNYLPVPSHIHYINLSSSTELLEFIQPYPTQYNKYFTDIGYGGTPFERTYYNWMHYHVKYKNSELPGFVSGITSTENVYKYDISGNTGWGLPSWPPPFNYTASTWSTWNGTSGGFGHRSGLTNEISGPIFTYGLSNASMGAQYQVVVCALTYLGWNYWDGGTGSPVPSIEVFNGLTLNNVYPTPSHTGFSLAMWYTYNLGGIQTVTSTTCWTQVFTGTVTANINLFRLTFPQRWQGYVTHVSFKRIMTAAEIDNIYGLPGRSVIVNSTSGLSWYGVSLALQNQIYYSSQIQGIPAYTPTSTMVYQYNFQDVALFEAYHKFRKAHPYPYINDLTPDSLHDYLNTMYSNYEHYNMLSGIYSELFNDVDKSDFKTMNDREQTSVLNFSKNAGIQISSLNVTASESGFKDNFYDGKFYNGVFEGKWRGGKWLGGLWKGWNSLVIGNPNSAITDTLLPPNMVDLNSIEKQTNYVVDYEYLKKRKKYYDIAPWDTASKKYNEKIPPVLRKNDRRSI